MHLSDRFRSMILNLNPQVLRIAGSASNPQADQGDLTVVEWLAEQNQAKKLKNKFVQIDLRSTYNHVTLRRLENTNLWLGRELIEINGPLSSSVKRKPDLSVLLIVGDSLISISNFWTLRKIEIWSGNGARMRSFIQCLITKSVRQCLITRSIRQCI